MHVNRPHSDISRCIYITCLKTFETGKYTIALNANLKPDVDLVTMPCLLVLQTFSA